MGKYVSKPEPPKGRMFANCIVTRKQARYIARKNMEEAGMKQFCKSHRYRIQTPTGQYMDMVDPSVFATRWRDYVEVAY